jgi:hypothetical protein
MNIVDLWLSSTNAFKDPDSNSEFQQNRMLPACATLTASVAQIKIRLFLHDEVAL